MIYVEEASQKQAESKAANWSANIALNCQQSGDTQIQ